MRSSDRAWSQRAPRARKSTAPKRRALKIHPIMLPLPSNLAGSLPVCLSPRRPPFRLPNEKLAVLAELNPGFCSDGGGFPTCGASRMMHPSPHRTGPSRAHVNHMHLSRITKTSVIAFALLLGLSSAGRVHGQSTDDKPKADNTAVNKRDQNPGEATADQQKMNAADRALTAKIRKAVMADKSLSTYAHNVKIISQNGTVTLKGPVHSDDEVKSIMAKATEGAGSPDKIVNQMSVKP